ncbi:hypothetical protein Glove_103g137 [Diversispora epigaea]|uniref:DNA (cytosine-5-)-methyltransferase n=1 Tax=Diversispora epigaea TaxID=1348612 RepID=A0A397J790_9GLOM|nr:hypothetical protein Glove_103g137 [Diversispora epigaea]
MFCGAGGFSEGARQAGFRVKWGIDKDDSSIETFLYNHHNATVYNMEIDEFMSKKIRDAFHVDVLLAAPPCQGFTGANTRGNIIDMTTNMILVMNIPQALDILRPKVLVFENVKGFFNQKKSDEIYKLFVNDLLDIGYKIKTKILKATDFGICQRRERFIMLAVPTESNFPCWPEPTHYINSEVSDQVRANYREMNLLPTPTVDVAFRGLTAATPNMNYIKTVPYHLRRLKSNQIPSTVLCTISPGWDNIHPTIFRYISPRESARLQSFSDTYEFKGNLASQYRQVGNSVPPLLAKAIIKEVKFEIVTLLLIPGWDNIHPTIFRYISPRESARLQSFSDTYEFKGNLASQYRQGNSNTITDVILRFLIDHDEIVEIVETMVKIVEQIKIRRFRINNSKL